MHALTQRAAVAPRCGALRAQQRSRPRAAVAPRPAANATAAATPPAKPKRGPPPAWLARLSLARQPPWASVADGSVLTIELGGALPELAPSGGLGAPPPLTLPALLDALRKAAVDPRIAGIYVRVSPLAAGWAKLGEARRAIAAFRRSGKFSVAFMELASEREFYVASACEELYLPPGAYVSLRGLSVSGTFLRGVFDKVGIEPQVKRIGKYKSAGDQLARADMSDAQREVLSSLLAQIWEEWVAGVAQGRGKSADDVRALLDSPAPALTAAQLAEGGWVTGLLYADELKEQLAPRTGGPASELRRVDVARYARTRPQSLGLDLGPPKVGIIRAAGGISRGRARRGPGGGGGITNEDFLEQLARVKKDPRIKALLLRIDSPGGDALASDLMWRELKTLGKPVIASQSDVAASGGYYMSMACDTIVADALTLTGSIGVITGKFNLGELYRRIGFKRETLSRGRYAQVDADDRSFTPEEEAYFEANAQSAYASFRDKAAASRGMSVPDMEACAQGRVWTGAQAVERGLVDLVGGYDVALAAAKRAAGLEEDAPVTLVDFSARATGIGALLRGGAAALAQAVAAVGALNAAQDVLASAAAAAATSARAPQAAMEPLSVAGYATGGPDAELTAVLALLGGAPDASADPLSY